MRHQRAAEDGPSVGDCPFAHYVRIVLEEKRLEYQLKPEPPDAKPSWLLEYSDSKFVVSLIKIFEDESYRYTCS
jgi:hypothetical protein